jgi:hypothetical protein
MIAVDKNEIPFKSRKLGQLSNSLGAGCSIEANIRKHSGSGERIPYIAQMLGLSEHRVDNIEHQTCKRQVAGGPSHPASNFQTRFAAKLKRQIVEENRFVTTQKSDQRRSAVTIPIVFDVFPEIRPRVPLLVTNHHVGKASVRDNDRQPFGYVIPYRNIRRLC